MRLSAFALSCCFFCFSVQGDNEEDSSKKCVSSCPLGWEKMSGHCFFWSDASKILPKTWAKAEEFCKSKGGHLASVTNQAIHDYIWSKTLKPWRWTDGSIRRPSFWVGGTDQGKEGRWRWSDGSAWNFTQWATKPYMQPNNWSGNEHCLLIHDKQAENGWNDRDCRKEIRFCLQPTTLFGRQYKQQHQQQHHNR